MYKCVHACIVLCGVKTCTEHFKEVAGGAFIVPKFDHPV
jgi:hypothetical protein